MQQRKLAGSGTVFCVRYASGASRLASKVLDQTRLQFGNVLAVDVSVAILKVKSVT